MCPDFYTVDVWLIVVMSARLVSSICGIITLVVVRAIIMWLIIMISTRLVSAICDVFKAASCFLTILIRLRLTIVITIYRMARCT